MKIKKRMAIMSHLSDVQEMIGMGAACDAGPRINFVKALVMDPRGMDEEIETDELDVLMNGMQELRAASARIFELKMKKNALQNERDVEAVRASVYDMGKVNAKYQSGFDEINTELNGLLKREFDLRQSLNSKKK